MNAKEGRRYRHTVLEKGGGNEDFDRVFRPGAQDIGLLQGARSVLMSCRDTLPVSVCMYCTYRQRTEYKSNTQIQ